MNFARCNILRSFYRQVQLRNFSVVSLNQLYLLQPNPIYTTNRRHLSYLEEFSDFMVSIGKSTSVIWFQDHLIQFHELTQLPWSASIILSTIILRLTITTSLTIYQKVILARLELITKELSQIERGVSAEVAIGVKKLNWSDKQATFIYKISMKKQWNKLVVRDNCHPLKTIIVLWGQIPLWIIQSISIRNLTTLQPDPTAVQAQIVYLELATGGFGFIPNLTQCDSTFLLPISIGIINLCIIELQTVARSSSKKKNFQRITTNIFRGLSICMVPIAATVPAGLCLYWATSSAFGLVQHIFLMSPKIRRLVKIPITPSEQQKPYSHIKQALNDKFINVFRISTIKK